MNIKAFIQSKPSPPIERNANLNNLEMNNI